MVTGIEAAGLALGIFPLVIEGIKFYISFAKKVKQMKHYKRTLEQFRRELVMEKSKFDNTWFTLAKRAGIDIEPNKEPPQLAMKRLLSCLPKYVVESFIDACQEFSDTLGELREMFQRYNQDSVGMDQILARL